MPDFLTPDLREPEDTVQEPGLATAELSPPKSSSQRDKEEWLLEPRKSHIESVALGGTEPTQEDWEKTEIEATLTSLSSFPLISDGGSHCLSSAEVSGQGSLLVVHGIQPPRERTGYLLEPSEDIQHDKLRTVSVQVDV